MEQVVPWARLVDRLRPFYPKGERGRPPVGLERMLRLYWLEQHDLTRGLFDEVGAMLEERGLLMRQGTIRSIPAKPRNAWLSYSASSSASSANPYHCCKKYGGSSAPSSRPEPSPPTR
jgi:hypothetical protein